jgi:hypothetical protein
MQQKINVRNYRWGNQKWTIQKNWQHRVYRTQDKHKQSKNTGQNVLDTQYDLKMASYLRLIL